MPFCGSPTLITGGKILWILSKELWSIFTKLNLNPWVIFTEEIVKDLLQILTTF